MPPTIVADAIPVAIAALVALLLWLLLLGLPLFCRSRSLPPGSETSC